MEDLDPGDEEYYRKMEDFGVPTKSLESNGKLWRKGINLGKKIVVIGAVVTSVPFVLPPLVALSTIGFALSVPAGFIFVTYACGEKLMNTLLPMPSGQYKLMPSDEEAYRVYRDEDGFDERYVLYEEHKGLEAEGEKYEQDAQTGSVMRIELVEESNKEIDDYDQIPFSKDELDIRSVSEIVEEGVYEEDAADTKYMEDDEQPLDSKAISDILEGINEAENEISLMEQEGIRMPRDSLRAVVVEAELGGENESNVEQLTEDMAFVPPRELIQENGYGGNLAGIEEDELKSETTGLIEEIRDAGKNELKREDNQADETPEENDLFERVSEKDMSRGMVLEDLDVIPEELEPPMDDKGVIDDLDSDANYLTFEEDEISGLICDEPTSIVENQLVVNVRIDGDHTVTDVHQGTYSEKIGTLMLPYEDAMNMVDRSGFDTSNKGNVSPDLDVNSLDKMPEDARKMADENGFDLPNNGRLASDIIVDSLDKMPKGEDVSVSNAVEVTIDYHEVVIESATHEEKMRPNEETAAGSEKVKLAEEKVWEHINAMRTIVGYTNTPHTSYVEELKALYIFTGVEPPISSNNPADLSDINEKLHFLMSIVGVK